MARVGTFVVLTMLLSAPFWYLSREVGFNLYTILLMWCPAAAAYATTRLFHDVRFDFGLSRFAWKVTLAAYLVIVAVQISVHFGLWAGGIIQFPDPEQLADRAKALGMANSPDWWVLICYFVLTATAGGLSFSANALGEEIGWRGFLVPVLYDRLGFTQTALLSGLIWAGWHYPLLIGLADLRALLNFTMMVCGFSFVLCWFRLRALSVWPAVIFHGAHNALLQAYFLRFSLVLDERNSVWLDETGYALAAAAVLLGLIFWLIRNKADAAWKGRLATHTQRSS